VFCENSIFVSVPIQSSDSSFDWSQPTCLENNASRSAPSFSRFGSGTPIPEFGGYLLENELRVHPAGRELRPVSGQHAQESFTALVDKRDFVQVHDAGSPVISAVFLFPAGPEFTKPGSSKPSLENPSLLGRRFTKADLQHAVFLTGQTHCEGDVAECVRWYPPNLWCLSHASDWTSYSGSIFPVTSSSHEKAAL